jgi:hypothetical protein
MQRLGLFTLLSTAGAFSLLRMILAGKHNEILIAACKKQVAFLKNITKLITINIYYREGIHG